MDEELRILHEAMVVKERLRLLADLQVTYWEELLSRGFDQSMAEQLMMEWSRHAYGMTFRALPDPTSTFSSELGDLLGPEAGAQPPAPPTGGDPSSVPSGEPWLQLVEDLDLEDVDDDAHGSAEDRAA
jgi:hypothetical protein